MLHAFPALYCFTVVISKSICVSSQLLILFQYKLKTVISESFYCRSKDIDSEDEGPSKTKTQKKDIEPMEVAEGQEDDSGETGNGEDDDEDGDGNEDCEFSHEEGRTDSSDERDGKCLSASMSSRSESKSYSSVTHKCEVRNPSQFFMFVYSVLGFC